MRISSLPARKAAHVYGKERQPLDMCGYFQDMSGRSSDGETSWHSSNIRISLPQRQRGFTFLELVLVIVIIGLAVGLFSTRLGLLDFWREQTALRKLSETIVLLNNQAVMDQAFYRMEFDLSKNTYRVGVMRPDDTVTETQVPINLPPLVLELAALLSPDVPSGSTMIPPPSMPSLATPVLLPGKMVLLDVVTPRGKITREDNRENPFLLFSPRGFSEFGVIHISMGETSAVTILVNPWTGLAEVFREYKDFTWTLGRS